MSDTLTGMIAIHSPITGEELRRVPTQGAADADHVFAVAQTAAKTWQAIPATERSQLLLDVAKVMHERADEIAELETMNTGKSLKDTRRESERAADCMRYYAGWADKVTGTTIPVGEAFHTYTEREPYGVAVGIIPWNVPYFFAAKKIAPALAFGNVSILKPAEETPLTALALIDMLREAGVPEGVAQVVCGGADLGRALTADPRADLIVFTGYHETGKAIARAAAEHLTPVTLELGGKSPQIVFADADIEAAIDAVLLGIFGACGQMCIAGSRLLIERSIYDAVVDRIARRVRALQVGDPRDAHVQVGPQVTRTQMKKTQTMITSGIAAGARILAQARLPDDGRLRNGYFVPPTAFVDVQPEMEIMREEIFGPVLAIAPFADEDEALHMATDTEFGLAAGVWTSDVGRAHRVARALPVGTVWINSYRVLSDLVPFGGVGRSGYGREGGNDAVSLYTRTKSVWTSLAPGMPPAYAL
jgi:aldehyde dehydrogenase (NAD+)